MKKIISFLLVFLMIFIFSISAFAYNELTVYEETVSLSENASYDLIAVMRNGKLTIEEGTEIELIKNVQNDGTFEINGSLYGTVSSFNNSGSILLGPNGWINLRADDIFKMENTRDRLNQAGIETEVKELENGEYQITAGTNPSESKGHVHNYVCAVCGDTYTEEENALAASNFGFGSPAVITGAAGVIVGFAAAALLLKKKKIES